MTAKPGHLPPLQLFHDLSTCGPYVVPKDGNNLCNNRLAMCLYIEFPASRKTPRFLTDSAGSMLLPSKLTGKDDFRELLI